MQHGSVSSQTCSLIPQYGFVGPQYSFVSPQYGSVSPQYGFMSPQYGWNRWTLISIFSSFGFQAVFLEVFYQRDTAEKYNCLGNVEKGHPKTSRGLHISKWSFCYVPIAFAGYSELFIAVPARIYRSTETSRHKCENIKQLQQEKIYKIDITSNFKKSKENLKKPIEKQGKQ